MQTNAEILKTLLDITTDNIYVNNPCQVVNVNGNFVDVKIFINDEDEDCVLYNVPIQRPETQRAYIFLGIKKGDRGTLKFFDRSTENYLKGDYDYNSDDRQHDINDRAFELGFVPNDEAFVYPTDKEIEIGLKDSSCKISFEEKSSVNIISITAPIINLNGQVNISGDLSVIANTSGGKGSVTAGEVTAGEVTAGESLITLTKHIHTNTTAPTGNAE